jgi:hypothetical protein
MESAGIRLTRSSRISFLGADSMSTNLFRFSGLGWVLALSGMAMAFTAGPAVVRGQAELDRTVLPIREPTPQVYQELDARDATPVGSRWPLWRLVGLNEPGQAGIQRQLFGARTVSGSIAAGGGTGQAHAQGRV